MSFQNLIRTGNERGLLLGRWPDWTRYRDMRSKTRHTYDENIPLEVVTGIPEVLQEAQYLLARLLERLT